MLVSEQLGARRLSASWTRGLKLAVVPCVMASLVRAQRVPVPTHLGPELTPEAASAPTRVAILTSVVAPWRDVNRESIVIASCCSLLHSLTAPHAGLIATRDQRSARRPTTFAQRMFSAMLFGSAGLALYAAAERGTKRWGLPIYVAGSAGGVMVATIGRERARPIATTVGAVVGAVPGVWASLTPRSPEGPGKELSLAVACFFTVPLGAAIGHGVGR